MCTNTPHMVYSSVQPQIGIPILHIADATGEAATHQGLMKLGLLGNRPTITGDFISKRLKDQYEIEVLLPDENAIERSHYFVSQELTRGKFTEERSEERRVGKERGEGRWREE